MSGKPSPPAASAARAPAPSGAGSGSRARDTFGAGGAEPGSFPRAVIFAPAPGGQCQRLGSREPGHSQLAADYADDGGTRPDLDLPAMSSPVINETSGDERKVRARPTAFPVNGINESGTSPRAPNRPAYSGLGSVPGSPGK